MPFLIQQAVTSIATAYARRRQIRHRAFHDELTGLPNRYLFRDRLEQALAQARRRGGGLALVYADVDQFKAVNDGFGHWAGDELLKHVGNCLSMALRKGDTAARLGGDEFALLLLEVEDEAMIRGAIVRVQDALRRPVIIEGRSLSVSCSIGYSIFPDDGLDAPGLLRSADMSMYRHKNR